MLANKTNKKKTKTNEEKIMKDWPNLACAIYVWDNANWVCIDDPDISVSTDRNLVTDSLERIHYRKELIQNLTQDAAYLISVVLDTPDDFINCICGIDGEPKKTRLIAFLNVAGWKPRKIKKAFHEVSKFVKEYYGS